jgi:ParB family chromosome partitioning protein
MTLLSSNCNKNSINEGKGSQHFFGQIDDVPLKDIRMPTHNLRNRWEDPQINQIANSIKQHGLLQPIIVRLITTTPKENINDEREQFEIVAGCRRFLACQSIHWKKIPCHIVHLNDMQMFEVSLIENIERKSLSPLEEGNAFKKYVCDKGWGSVAKLSSKIGKSSSYITKRIALLDLPEDVKKAIENSNLSPSTAEELIPVKDGNTQSYLASLISRRHLSTKKAREMIKTEGNSGETEEKTDDPFYCENSEILDVRRQLQPFNKSIVALRIAMNRLATVMEDIREEQEKAGNTMESNELIYELLRHHTKTLNDQIDSLMRAKKKYAKNIFKYQKMLDS